VARSLVLDSKWSARRCRAAAGTELEESTPGIELYCSESSCCTGKPEARNLTWPGVPVTCQNTSVHDLNNSVLNCLVTPFGWKIKAESESEDSARELSRCHDESDACSLSEALKKL
jgi:hypothetical protein